MATRTISGRYTESIRKNDVSLWTWIEIEGLPYAYGNFYATSSLFSARTGSAQFDGIRPLLTDPLKGFNSTVNPLDGTATIGTTEFSLLNLNDVLTTELGLSVAKTQNALMLSSSMSATTSSFVVLSSSNVSNYSRPGVVYIDKETIGYTTWTTQSYGARTDIEFRGLTRGKYYSSASEHSAGRVLFPNPVHLGQRIARAYYFVSSSAPVSSSQVESDSVLRSVGVITACSLGGGGTTYDLKMDSIQRRISGFVSSVRKSKLFSNRFKSKLAIGLAGRNESGQIVDPAKDEDDAKNYLNATDGTGPIDTHLGCRLTDTSIERFRQNVTGSLAAFNNNRSRGYSFFVKVGDKEIMLLKWAATSAKYRSLQIVARGLFGTKPVQHEKDEDVNEIMVLAGTQDGATATSPSDPYYYLPTLKDHPLSIFLSMLMSTGTGTNGTYDVLPADWSLGVGQAWIDVTEIESTRDTSIGGVRCAGVVTDEFEATEFFRSQIFQPFGVFPLFKLNGLYSVRRLSVPTAIADGTSINEADVVDVPTWDSNIESAIGRVVYKYDKNIDDKYDSVHEIVSPSAESMYDGIFGTVERDSALLRSSTDAPGDDGRLWFPKLANAGSAYQWTLSQAGWWQAFFERPVPVVGIKCKWSKHTLEPGDNVYLSLNAIPNISSGSIGITSGSFTITSKKINDKQGTVDFELMQLGISNQQFRKIAPSAIVSSYNAGTRTVTIKTGANDCAAAGTMDTDYLEVPYIVQVCTPTLESKSDPITIQSINKTLGTFVFPSAPTVTPAAGYVIEFCTYDTAIAAQTSTYAFWADTNRKLGATNLPAHEFIP